jgi:hypothetical protein
VNRAFRRVWGDSLLHARNSPGHDRAVSPGAGGLSPQLAGLEELAGRGLLAAEEILRHAGKPGKHIERIKSRLDAIRDCASKIRETGLRVPLLNGLCQMFAFEEENMAQGGLQAAAAENVEIFGKLLRRTRSVAYLLQDGEGAGAPPREGRA